MSQVPLKYNADDPAGQWRLLRTVTAPDPDFVATQTRPTDELRLGVRPPGPSDFEGLRFYLEFFDTANPDVVIPGGTWDMQLIEAAILPVITLGQDNPIRVVGGQLLPALDSLSVYTVGGWRDAALSMRLAAFALPGGANAARIYVREF